MQLTTPGLRALSLAISAQTREVGPDCMRERAERRSTGAFFTPTALVTFVVEQALGRLFSSRMVRWHPRGYPLLTILDPAAGDGRFILEALAWLLRRGQAEGRPCDPALILENCMIAIERDAEYASLLKERLGSKAQVLCAEALLSGVVSDQSVDIVLGNPPYLRSIALGRTDMRLREALRGRYASTSYGEWDLYAAFLEQGMRWIGPQGHLAMVVPSRFWTAQWAGPLRANFSERGFVSALVDFGSAKIFSDATVYASLCFASHVVSESLEVARLSKSGWQIGIVERSSIAGRKPWSIAVGPSGKLLKNLASVGPVLGDIARIAKGTGTCADSSFLVHERDSQVEPELLHAVLRGRDIRAMGEIPRWPKLLVPYHRSGVLIDPHVMMEKCPGAYAHLLAHRCKLEARERGRFSGERFYRFGRPQNLRFLMEVAEKVVVPDVTREGRALLDCQGTMVLDSAYAIRLNDSGDLGLDHATLCGILNSPIVALWLESRGVCLCGGYTRMKTAFLKEMPIPTSSEAQHIGTLVQRGATLEQIREQVRIAYHLSRQQWAHIST